ncbi:succinyl-diaminopimelate desuccinylase [Helicobacter cappadocius]|uniref:Succinyl-diaminopimelate desuccinylase n=1 Tax=Helicobacter cappadocius TaxID=3063998 RepID=A0AA90PK49_9HELI|nr:MULTISPECIES: succinyl-diaminopimelate desuccinylase [unclassified Helicobacter]MDO7252776.1 succinyl-diaminopimelate desuccinylase [Helicobacter sp. faydin-H75]MDP2538644.1 succinyl-diaminopimelate desuccinylase [Helicobacter sp. faydin-H76]
MYPNVCEFLSHLISYPSVTPKECGIYDFIQSQLPDFEVLTIHEGDVKNIFLFKHFKVGEGKPLHLCFAGHIDVVPPGDGWEYDPFKSTLKDGYLYGRGAQDMKSGVSAFICAIRDFATTYSSAQAKQSLIISVLLTSDEEGPGIYGTKVVLETLKKRNLLPDMAIVAEPTCSMKIGDTIKIGRRGSINGVINIQGIQGHVAYPEKCSNPIELLGDKLGLIAGIELDDGDEHFSPSKLVVTDIRGGIQAVNVTPANLKMMFNIRNSTRTNITDVETYIKKILNGLKYDLELKQSSMPFITSSNSKIAKVLSSVVVEICSITPSFSTSGGTSDARYFSSFGVEVVEFGVLNDRIHSANECVKIEDLRILYEVFLKTIHCFNQGVNK